MAATFSIPLQDGTHDFDVVGATPGYHPIIFSYLTKPTAGRMAVFVRYGADDDWQPVLEAQNIDMRGAGIAVAWGLVDSYRFVISGVSGGSGLTVRIDDSEVWPGPGFPPGAFEGLRALTVQNYVEANVKNGVQHVLATYVPAFPAAPGFTDYIVQVGAKPIAIKGRTFQFDGSGIQLDIFRGPVFTGGTPYPYYNQNDINPVAGLAVVLTGVTVSNTGTRIAPTRTLLGSTGQGNSVLTSSISEADGLETILRPNTNYLFRTTSLHNAPQRVTSANTWYEGDFDLPRQ